MDCQMPIMDGWKATQKLTEMMMRKQIPFISIIGLTAFTSKADIDRCLESGMQEVLGKPFKLEQFKKILMEAH